MTETREDRIASWNAYIASHQNAAQGLRAAATEPQPAALRAGLASLHEAVAMLAIQLRDREGQQSDPIHAEYHKVRQAHLYASAGDRFKSAADFGQIGIRSMIIAHGGALVAMLAFVGQVRVVGAGCGVWLAFAAFAAGLICALLAVLFAYETQSSYARQDDAGADKIYFGLLNDKTKEAEQDTEESAQMAKGQGWEKLAVATFLVSLALFIGGAVAGVWALTSIPSVP